MIPVRRVSVVALLLSVALASPPPAHAEGASDAARAEAAERFDRGLALFEDGDNAGALAEFLRTYELQPLPIVLYNVALVYAAMHRPVEAADALAKVVEGAGLSPEQRARAVAQLAEQRARIGRLVVTTAPPGARVEVDNVQVATTPLAAPLRVSAGSHIVGAVAEGYTPARREVVIAGNAEAAVHIELVSSQGKPIGNLTVRSRVPGAELWVDNERVGRTPVATSVAVVAGHHRVELRRPGYRTAVREIDLTAGGTGELDLDLEVDRARLGSEGGALALDISEPGAVVFVDDQHLGAYQGALRLPRGPHRLRVERGGFLPVEREVSVDATSAPLRVVLEPTPETRASYESSANAHRLWGWVGVAAGAVIGGAGTTWLLVNGGIDPTAERELDEIYAAVDGKQDWPGNGDVQDCNTTSGGNADVCNALVKDFEARYDSARNEASAKDLVGYVGVGVGAAALVTGVVLLVTGDDPDRYRRDGSGQLGQVRPAPSPGGLGGGLQITF